MWFFISIRSSKSFVSLLFFGLTFGMATSAVTKAKNELVRMNERIRRSKLAEKAQQANLVQSAAVLAGAGAAALIDEKFGEEGEEATLFGGRVPTNLVVGGGTVAAAAMFKIPMRKEVAALGLGVTSAAVYQMVRDNVDFDD